MLGLFVQLVEFFCRLWLVNVPTYLITAVPEVVTVVTYLYSYVLIQNVAFCWAFLVNACIAVACKVAAILPFDDGSSIMTFFASFYLVYSSVRVATYFGTYTAKCAIACLQNFSGIERAFSIDNDSMRKIFHIFFTTLLLLELALISADAMCSTWVTPSLHWLTCRNSGLQLLSQDHASNRRLLFCLLAVVVYMSWQALLHQLPRWDRALANAASSVKFAFQLSLGLLVIFTTLAAGTLFIHIPSGLYIHYDYFRVLTLTGWTLWLYSFAPYLFQSTGASWLKSANVKSLKRLALCLCITQCVMVLLYSSYRSLEIGLIAAQLEFVVASFCVPSFCIVLTMLVKTLFQVFTIPPTFLAVSRPHLIDTRLVCRSGCRWRRWAALRSWLWPCT
jgi:hypothetical protein